MPNNNNDTTTSLGINVSEFKRGLQDATRQIKLANAEFKAASAGMDKWSDSTTGVQAKIKQLESVLDAENKKLDVQKQRLIEVEREQGKNSAAADELRISIANQQASIAKTEKSLGYYNNKLSDLQKSENEAKTATGQLTSTIDAQQKELDELKQKYANVVLEQGKNSKEAKALGAQISALSGNLSDNKQKLSDAESAADQYDNSLKETGKAADDAGEKVNNFGGVVSKIGVAVTATLAAVGAAAIAAGKKIWDMASETAKVGDTIDKESQKLQISAENYQKLSYAAERSGMSIDDLSKGMTNITKSLANAQNGVDGATASFDAIGVSLQNADGSFKSTENVLLDTIDALASMEDETQRNAAAQEIFGRSYAELLPLLNSGADGIAELMQEAEDYGMVMSDEAVAASAAFEDSLTRLSGTFNGLKNNIMGAFLPSLSSIVDGFSDLLAGVDGAGDKIKNGVTGVLSTISQQLPRVSAILSTIFDTILSQAPNLLGELANMVVGVIPSIIRGVLSAAPQLTSTILSVIGLILDTFSREIPNIISLFTSMFPQVVSAILSAAPDLLRAFVSLLSSVVQSIPLIVPYLKTELPKLIQMIVNLLNDGIPFLISAGLDLLNGLLAALPLILPVLVSQIGNLVVSITNALVSNADVLLNGAIQALNAIISALPIIADALTPEIINLVLMVSQCLIDNAPVLASAALQFFWVIITEVLPQLFAALVDLAADFIEIFVETWLKPVIQNFQDSWQAIQEIFSVVAEWFGEQFTKAYTAIKNAFSSIGSFFSDKWTAVKNAFANVGSWFKSKFSDAWAKIKQVFTPVGQFFGGIWDTIKEKFTEVGTKVGDAVGGAFKRVINAVLSGAVGIINKFIRGINKVIDLVNEIPGVDLGTLKELDVPQMARGGILKKGQVGLLEGNGSEAVVPLDQNKKWINATARDMKQALSNEGVINNNGGNITYNFTQNNNSPKALSRLEIYRQTKNQLNFATGV